MVKTIIMKECSKCKIPKSLDEFHKDHTQKDGYCSWCKTCKSLYWKSKDGVRVRKRFAKTEKFAIIQKRFQTTDKFKKAQKRFRQKYITAFPERIRAQEAVHQATRSGKMPKASKLKSDFCSKQAIEYHHPSYAPEHKLDVVPVCIPCHRIIHKK